MPASSTTALLAVLLCLAACGPASMTTPDLGDEPACVPGEQIECDCLGGAKGVQICQADGRRFKPCSGCPGEDGGPPPPSTSDDADLGTGNPCGECEGCCDGDACVPLADESDLQCGTKGSACKPCSMGYGCAQGVCVVDTGQCTPASCPNGCCVGTICVPPASQSWAACGTSGASCQTCSSGVVCSGTCTDLIDVNANFFIRVKSISVHDTDASGSAWDSFNGKPDLKVCFGDQSRSGCAAECTNTASCTPTGANAVVVDGSGKAVSFTGATLKQGIGLAVYDVDDFNTDDTIGAGTFVPITNKQASYSTAAFGRVIQLTFEIY